MPTNTLKSNSYFASTEYITAELFPGFFASKERNAQERKKLSCSNFSYLTFLSSG